MVQSAAVLMRERGLAGTSFREVLEHSGAPRGSIYHHFPEGKNQLIEEAVRAAGDAGGALITAGARDGDPVAALRGFVTMWSENLEASDYRAGCLVLAVATEAGADEPQLTQAAADSFAAWHAALVATLRAGGVTPARSRRLATMTIAAVEGAVVLCRAERSGQPLRDVGAELELLLKSALA
ncbi:MAG: transcriptional regulator, TetR family [Solirubrobacterales bacterium]|nr:transcriptional regulator, TetR family [Solirubrobacterales bacterium]